MSGYYLGVAGYFSGTGPAFWTGNGPGQIGTGQKGGVSSGGGGGTPKTATQPPASSGGWGPIPGICECDFEATARLLADPKADLWCKRRRIAQTIEIANYDLGRLARNYDDALREFMDRCGDVNRYSNTPIWQLKVAGDRVASAYDSLNRAADRARQNLPTIQTCLAFLKETKGPSTKTAWLESLDVATATRRRQVYVDSFLDTHGKQVFERYLASCPNAPKPTSINPNLKLSRPYPAPEQLELVRPYVDPKTLARLGL
jgi:hypothetical protein